MGISGAIRKLRFQECRRREAPTEQQEEEAARKPEAAVRQAQRGGEAQSALPQSEACRPRAAYAQGGRVPQLPLAPAAQDGVCYGGQALPLRAAALQQGPGVRVQQPGA